MNQVPIFETGDAARSAGEAALLAGLLRAFLEDRPLDALLGTVLDGLLALNWLSPGGGGGILLAETEGMPARLVAGRNLDPATGDGAWIEGSASPQRHHVLPIRSAGGRHGYLVVQRPEGPEPSPGDLAFLESLADMIGRLADAKGREPRAGPGSVAGSLAGAECMLRTLRRHMIFCETSRDGRIIDVNEAFCDISGYAREELVGAPHSITASGIHDAAFWASFWSTIAGGTVWRGEICNRRKDGSLYRVESIVVPLCDEGGQPCRHVAIWEDVSERRSTEGRMSRMGRILENSLNEIYVFEAESLRFVQVNRGARRNLGYTLEELLRLTPLDIKPGYDVEGFRELIAPLLRGEMEACHFETLHQRKDGSTYPVEIKLHYSGDEVPPVLVANVQDVTDRRRSQAQIEQLAYYDPLTGLANRTLMRKRLVEAVETARSTGRQMHVVYLDLNHFKEINDTRGHAVGDRVLRDVAERFEALLRWSETLARIGGDEFVVIVQGCGREEVRSLISRLSQALMKPVVVEERSHHLSVSIGVASFPEDGEDPDELLRLADIAMYEAKIRGGDHRFYSRDMGIARSKRQEIAERLATALHSDQFTLHYQAFVDLETRRLRGAEALLRWDSPEWGSVPAGDFVPIAAERRMMTDIGAWVVEKACRQLAAWRDAGTPLPGRLAINVAAEQMEDDALLAGIRRATGRHGISPHALEAEITESSMMVDPVRAADLLKRLKEEGVGLSIDDFGTGYSSLAYLKQFATDKLKIDMSFVHELLEDPNCQAIVTATIAMARGLGLTVLAEGVESEAQALWLTEIGCDEAQGFLFGRPVPAEEFAATWLGRGLGGGAD